LAIGRREGFQVVSRKSIIPLTIRLRDPLHGKLVRAAKAHDISLNEEIEQRLSSSLAHENWLQERERDRELWQREREFLFMLMRTSLFVPPEKRDEMLAQIERYENPPDEIEEEQLMRILETVLSAKEARKKRA
jgi:HicB family